jgi:hypothetical protein
LAVLALDDAERGERGQIRADPGDCSGGGEIVLTVRQEPAGG